MGELLDDGQNPVALADARNVLNLRELSSNGRKLSSNSRKHSSNGLYRMVDCAKPRLRW